MCKNKKTMYEIARHFNDLNHEGNIKGMLPDEKGFACIQTLFLGCSLFVRFEVDDSLRLSLMIKKTARDNNDVLCSSAVDLMKQHFTCVQSSVWFSALDINGMREHHYIDVTQLTAEEIIKNAEVMKKAYLKLLKKV